MTKTYKILLVDDMVENMFIISQIFKNEEKPYQTFQATNAYDAKKMGFDILPDLIITDWDMPDVSGIELIRYFKRQTFTKNIPIIIATGVMTSSENLKEALDAGAMDFVRKPLDEVELCARAQSALTVTEFYKQSIENKNYELSVRLANLVNNRKFVAKINREIVKLSKTIKSDDHHSQKIINEIISDLEHNKNRNTWSNFETSFRNSYSDFQKLLLEKHPNLTNTELKLCHLIKLDMDCKKIATTLHVSEQSVRVARSRMRKKLNLERDENIRNYLMMF